MKKFLSTIILVIMIFSLSACGNNDPIVVEQIVEEKKPTPPFTEVSNTLETIKFTDPFEDDILLDRFEDTLYYFNYELGFYTTDPDGKEQERIKVIRIKDVCFFNTPNRLNQTRTYGDGFKNIITRSPYEQIELLFASSDWLFYRIKDINNNYKYFKYNLSGTSLEVKRDEINNLDFPKVYPEYYYPEQLDSTINYENGTYRSRINNFSITFPDYWSGNYEIVDKKDLFIVKFKSRLNDSLNYEFLRIKKMNNERDWLPEIEGANTVFVNKNGQYTIGRYKDKIDKENIEYDLIQKMDLALPSIIYSLRR